MIGAKWKMTILHDIHAFDSIRFNEIVKNLGVTEKVLSQQLKELIEDGLVTRLDYEVLPPKTEYYQTEWGEGLIAALDLRYIWGIKGLDDLQLPIDPDAFFSHQDERYVKHLKDIMDKSDWDAPSQIKKLWSEEWHE